jgi:Flp pilus assembly protein TadG
MKTCRFPILRSFDDLASEKTVGNPQFEVPPAVKLEKRCWRCRRFRQGAAVVEFAVVAPVFFLLVIGMIEFGRAIMVQQVMTNASREGARVGVLDSATPTASLVKQTVVDYCVNGGLPTVTTSCVSIDAGAAHSGEPTAAGYGESVKVTVQVPYNSVTWIPAPWFLKDKTLQASTVMRRETVQ